MEKIDILHARILDLINNLADNTAKYELKLLFEEYIKQVNKNILEVKKSCKKKLKNKE